MSAKAQKPGRVPASELVQLNPQVVIHRVPQLLDAARRRSPHTFPSAVVRG